ncbi:MAG TPA: short-chain dehydrogenase [Oceanospirillales bacterium]|nr:short-chain dehydrogenase [Oceanospirillales bacterium]|tara:strand:+ start:9181 stop:9960 length:780 start_codon:yes stop_codon:yes gene_type:complete
MKLKQKCLFITGAAAGIGKATSLRFAEAGWFVGIADVDELGLKALAREIGSDNCMTLKLDVTSADDWQRGLDSFWKKTGRLDLLVNNAGVLSSGPFETIDLKAQQRMVDINVTGTVNGCHSAFPYLKDTRESRVINLCSASAMYGQPSLAVYSATKFAIKGLTEALNLEWEPHRIRVMDILPLFVRTAMVTDMNARSVRRMGVKLTVNDVTRVIYQAATTNRHRSKVHWPVGSDTKFLYLLSSISPDWMNRMVNKYVGM